MKNNNSLFSQSGKKAKSVAHKNIYTFLNALKSLSGILGKHLFWFLKLL